MVNSIAEELRGVQFGDRRLSDRAVKIAERFSAKPNLSIPAAMGDHAEMEAAYRFFDNDKVNPQAITAPHARATLERIKQVDTALLVQDTTEIDLTRPEQQVIGVGPLECESHQGLHYHPLLAFDHQGLALGTVWSKSWVRDEILTNVPRSEKEKLRRAAPIEDKESMRWLEGIRAARETAKACPQTQCICVADSEADIYELFSEPRDIGSGRELGLLIRGCQDRALSPSEEHGRILEAVRASPCCQRGTINVSRRRPKMKVKKKDPSASRDARLAEVEIRATTVTLRPPRRPDRRLPEVTINVVFVEEFDPPEGETPIRWLLLTNLPIDDVAQVELVIHFYRVRWQIEVYFRTLKSGCRIEKRYFQRVGRLLNCLALYSVVAWEILYLCRLSRQCPDLCCEVVFEPHEWKSIYMATGKKPLPAKPPTLNEIVRRIASMGGYVIRKSTQPGTQTLWIGLQRLHDFSTAWQAFGPDTRT